MYIFSMILLVMFAIIGLCSFITLLLDMAYRGKHEAIIQLKELSADNAEARIRSAAHICRTHPGYRLQCFCKENGAVYDICQLMQKDYPFLEIITEQDENKDRT